jgi:serine/threonine protein phosphatase PrpC
MNGFKKENTGTIDKVVIASTQHIGYGQKRKTLEDRCEAVKIPFKTSAGSEDFYLGIVADGIGGANAGEVAGTIATETIVDFIKNNPSTDFKIVLQSALVEANRVVRQNKTPEMRSMGTTCTTALIFQNKLYLAHVGDSRAYLIREGTITQLTLDHTWGNDKLRKGTFTKEEVATNLKAGELMRYIGQPTQLEVDLGVHMEDPISPKADPQYADGLPLQPGDTILLCTDGLIKERANRPGQFYASPKELVDVTSKNLPQDAANTLVSLALGRQVDDNVSVVLLEIPGQKKAFTGPQSPAASRAETLGTINKLPVSKLTIGIAAALLLVVALIVAIAFSANNDTTASPQPSAVSTDDPYNVMPMATSTPPLAAEAGSIKLNTGAAQVAISKDSPTENLIPNASKLLRDDALVNTSALRADLSLPEDVRLILDAKSGLKVKQLASGSGQPNTRLEIINYGVLLVSGTNVSIGAETRTFRANLKNGLMGVHFDLKRGLFTLDCLKGNCVLAASDTQQMVLSGGQRATIEGGQLAQDPQKPAPADFDSWRAWTEAVNMVPTITPTPSPTATATPTVTPTLTPKPAIIVPVEPTAAPNNNNNNPPPPNPGGD